MEEKNHEAVFEEKKQEKESQNHSGKKITLAQKILLYTIYSLVVLMVIFSFLSLKNKGQEGYDKCIQEKCERKGQEFCQKPREVQNCCLGASGKVGISGSQYVCVFE